MKDNIKPEGSHCDILLIEDDLATVRLVKNYFESEGVTCNVHFYKTYRKGFYFFQKNKIVFLPKKLEGILEEIEKNPPKVVLLKIILSDVSGYEICKKIKSNQKLKHIPVFFFTTMPGSEVEKHLAETKADGYILKPFNFSDLDGIFDLLNLQKNNESTKNSITPRLTDEETEKHGIVKDNIKPEGSHYDIDEFRKEREWLKIQFGDLKDKIKPEFYRRKLEDREGPFKIIIFGEESLGKTTLVNEYLTKKYDDDKKRITFGVDFYLKELEINGKHVLLQLWDLKGEERFRILLPTYCLGANGAFILYDLTRAQTLDKIGEWVNIIHQKGGDIPIILVGILADDKNDREVSEEEGKKIADSMNLSGYIECNLKTGQSFPPTFIDLRRVAMLISFYLFYVWICFF